MNLAYPVTIVITRPLPFPRSVTHRGVAATEFRNVVVTTPFIRVYHGLRFCCLIYKCFQCLLIRMRHDLQPHRPRLSADDPDHGRTVVFHRPVPLDLVGPTPGRILRVLVWDPFFSGVLIHFVGFDMIVLQGFSIQIGLCLCLEFVSKIQEMPSAT